MEKYASIEVEQNNQTHECCETVCGVSEIGKAIGTTMLFSTCEAEANENRNQHE
jgi:hypothetical protein